MEITPCDHYTKRGLPDIRIDPYFWKTVVGQLSRPFLGGEVKETPHFWVFAFLTYTTDTFCKKMSQNGQLCPQ